MIKGFITEIDSKTAIEFLLPKHYSGRTPPYRKRMVGTRITIQRKVT